VPIGIDQIAVMS